MLCSASPCLRDAAIDRSRREPTTSVVSSSWVTKVAVDHGRWVTCISYIGLDPYVPGHGLAKNLRTGWATEIQAQIWGEIVFACVHSQEDVTP